ncbi:hypothetical protein [Halopiger djelfimassiliensis]|uniref:hypothetical protein n=1 Tax=Halopiger djelfimassiliensis TaxID=1293047 RepID=UPI000677B399|nr:hypothetical protein [Halopiger djelfimassiliensis]
MPEKEQQDKTLSEIVVKEAVGRGLESPMRDSILEAVEEADTARRRRRLPVVGAVFGLGAALGFLAGRQSPPLEETPLEDVEEPEIIEDVMETDEGKAETMMETEGDEATDSSSRLPRLLLALGVVAGIAYLRRRFAGEETEEWEPIEEFEPGTDEEAEDEEPEAEESETADEDETEAETEE